jgi:NAD(P)-dependent dehydrogenase (short-subunit alcohol dehydrogenase family)
MGMPEETALQLLDLRGVSVAVTGGGSGIGRATALLAAQLGASVVAGDRNDSGVAALADEAERAGLDVSGVALDVTDRGSIDAFLAAATAKAPLWGIVSSAGIAPVVPALDLTPQAWQEVLSVNLTGTWDVAQAAARILVEQGRGGSIVNVGSNASTFGPADLAHYTASKAAVVGVSKTLARELGRYDIRVNVVSPGAVDTPLYWDRPSHNDDVTKLPLARIGQPEDLARCALFLLSPLSSWITGQCILVNGGSIMQG